MKNQIVLFVMAAAGLCFFNAPAIAQSQGPHYPDSVWNNASAGNVAWVSPANAADSDAVYATVSLSTPGTKRSNYLMATHFHFSLPNTAKVTGITAQVYGHALPSVGAFVRAFGKLIKANVIQPDSLSGGGVTFTTNTWDTLGGCTNMWNDTTISYADVNDSGFGIAYYDILGNYSNTAYIDVIRITVCYIITTASGTVHQSQTSEGRIFPNPSAGTLFLDYKGIYNVKIYDAAMRLVYAKQLRGGQYVTLAALSNGIYELLITGQNYTDYKKLILQK